MENSKLIGEVWKPVPNYDGLYEVSNFGRVKTLARSHRYGIKNDRILKEGYGTTNYAHVALTKNGLMKTIRIHRIVAACFVSNPLNYSHVNHIDGNKKNNKANNLEWCDRSHNVRHAYENGLINKEKKRKIKISDIDRIRAEGKYASYKKIAENNCLSISSIYLILNGKIWAK